MKAPHMAMAAAVALLISRPMAAQQVPDYVMQLSASVQVVPPQIKLAWVRDARTTSLELYRKEPASTTWGAPRALSPSATSFSDTNVVAGKRYEYRVSKWTGDYAGEGYLVAGIQLPLIESRGKVVLIVDATHARALAMELKRLAQDLIGDGWSVVRHDVSRTATPTAVKALVQSEFAADPKGVRSVFLFGHVAVPYSGEINPDGHPEHRGAWPADSFYGDMTGAWTDTLVSSSAAADPRNRNIPGDGKFDQGVVVSDLEVGRVDLSNLPAFEKNEQELLRQYLDKNHAFRHGRFTMERRGLIDDHLGVSIGEAFAGCGWRNFAPFFGPTNAVAGDWLTTLRTQSFLWGYGCGGGTYTSAGGVATTAQLAAEDPRVVFSMFFGSYFGDWDTPNNFLRAALATPTYTLCSAWAGRPYWVAHHMALGETVGFSARVTQNNESVYAANDYPRVVSIALMGDPTLRMHVVPPPSGLTVATNHDAGVELSWSPAAAPVAGYAIYRASTSAGPFVRLNPALVEGTNFTDSTVSSTGATTNCYAVRAVKLEVSASGSYFNASQGIFQDLAGTFGPPVLSIAQTSDFVRLAWPVNLNDVRLEESPTLEPGDWNRVTNAVVLEAGRWSVEIQATAGQRFYRLSP